jgi:hypothetical protein
LFSEFVAPGEIVKEDISLGATTVAFYNEALYKGTFDSLKIEIEIEIEIGIEIGIEKK